jgi:hypothetical protein
MFMGALIRIIDLWEDKLIRFLALTWGTRGATIWLPALLVAAVILLFAAMR